MDLCTAAWDEDAFEDAAADGAATEAAAARAGAGAGSLRATFNSSFACSCTGSFFTPGAGAVSGKVPVVCCGPAGTAWTAVLEATGSFACFFFGGMVSGIALAAGFAVCSSVAGVVVLVFLFFAGAGFSETAEGAAAPRAGAAAADGDFFCRSDAVSAGEAVAGPAAGFTAESAAAISGFSIDLEAVFDEGAVFFAAGEDPAGFAGFRSERSASASLLEVLAVPDVSAAGEAGTSGVPMGASAFAIL